MKIIGMTYFRFAAAVAINCTERAMPDQDATPDEVAAYLEDVLELLFSSIGLAPRVRAVTYPKSCKIPLVIELSDEDAQIVFPKQIKVIKEVTDDDSYKNASLARSYEDT